ncbi:hypothetical protein ACFL30_01485 [Candidatus Latescibacterota bacterium]
MKSTISRRRFLSGSAALGAGSATLALTKSTGAAEVTAEFPSTFEAHTIPFMDQYYDGLMEIAHGVRKTQLENIAAAMEKAYECQRKKGKIYSHLLVGHFSMFAGSPDRPGQPNLLPQRVDRNTREDFAAMKKGDFLITNGVSQAALDAREKGVFVVGITNNYVKFAKTPPDFLRPGAKLAIEDISDLVIDSHVPYYNGLVNAPLITGFRICPSSGISQFLIYWACTAALANLIGTKGKGSGTQHAGQYLDMAIERFEMIGTDRPKIDYVGEKWADLVLGEKARLMVYGQPQEVKPYGGTRNVFVNEAYIVASGSMIAQRYEHMANELRRGDIVLIGALTSDNHLEINCARHAKNAGAYSTAFCPYGTDGDSSGPRLFKEVDTAFNTYSDESEGVLDIKGFDKKICPLTGLTGNMVHWMLMAQWTDHMARRGEMPYYWQGFHERDGQAYDKLAEPIYKKRGY